MDRGWGLAHCPTTSQCTGDLQRDTPDNDHDNAQNNVFCINFDDYFCYYKHNVTHAHAAVGLLDAHGIKGQKPWRDRVSEHQTIANETFRIVSNKYASGDVPQISFQVLVYLPYPKDAPGQHCLGPDKAPYFVEGTQKHGVNYFVHYYRNSTALNTCLDRLWRRIQGKRPEILDAVFSPDTKDLCEETSNKVGASTDTDCGYSGVTAVRCGHEFVWYELSYRYFTAGRAAGASFELSTGDTAYERSCGQIFLFP